MSFAEKILKKYGWKEGDGLGKNLDGIAKPLKASLKFDSAGLGVDKAAEFNNHWWERVFNEAANNVKIEKDGDKVSVNVNNDESVEITTKDYSVRKLKSKNRDAYDNFLSSVTLTNTGAEITKPDKIDVDEIMVTTHKPLTDEELFAACGGRTAHKGARHGLKLSGKLARIEKQEQEMLLKMQSATADDVPQTWTIVKNKKKKNKEKTNENDQEEPVEDDESKLNSILYTTEYCIKSKKKRKEKKKTEEELTDCLGSFSIQTEKKDDVLLGMCNDSKIIKKTKKSKKARNNDNSEKWDTYREVDSEKEAPENIIEIEDIVDEQIDNPEGTIKKKKHKKCKHGIDKDAKEAHKMAKKLKKNLKHVTDDLERSILVETI